MDDNEKLYRALQLIDSIESNLGTRPIGNPLDKLWSTERMIRAFKESIDPPRALARNRIDAGSSRGE